MSSQSANATAPVVKPPNRQKTRWRRRVAVLAGLIVAGLLIRYVTFRKGRVEAETQEGAVAAPSASSLPSVEVVRPKRGGIERATVQPGSILAFESVDLYAMVSGYLKTQVVDIGSHMKKGQVLAEIDAPREAKAVEEAESLLAQARAKVVQAQAEVKAMEAQRDVAAATVNQSRSDVARLVASRELAEKQFERINGLLARNAVDRRLADEHQRDVDAAKAAEQTARLAVLTAEAQKAAAAAKVDQARADLATAQAAAQVATARLGIAQVNLDYTRIVAPFDGVVTSRTFHPGAFIRSAVGGEGTPLLTVKRTDLMRVVVQVPDRDVVQTNEGDTAVVTVDALEGRKFRGNVARIGESEDSTTRTMRVEIDLPNPDRLLREGMYGSCSIRLDPETHNLTIPRVCVAEPAGRGKGVVYVVRNNEAHRIVIELGADNGSLVEVLSGLGPNDDVVFHSGTRLEDGAPVIAATATTAQTSQ